MLRKAAAVERPDQALLPHPGDVLAAREDHVVAGAAPDLRQHRLEVVEVRLEDVDPVAVGEGLLQRRVHVLRPVVDMEIPVDLGHDDLGGRRLVDRPLHRAAGETAEAIGRQAEPRAGAQELTAVPPVIAHAALAFEPDAGRQVGAQQLLRTADAGRQHSLPRDGGVVDRHLDRQPVDHRGQRQRCALGIRSLELAIGDALFDHAGEQGPPLALDAALRVAGLLIVEGAGPELEPEGPVGVLRADLEQLAELGRGALERLEPPSDELVEAAARPRSGRR